MIKSKHRGKTDGEQEMRVAVSNQIPGFERLCPAPLAHHTRTTSKRLWLFKDETKISFFPNLYAFFSLLICICLTALVLLWHAGFSLFLASVFLVARGI